MGCALYRHALQIKTDLNIRNLYGYKYASKLYYHQATVGTENLLEPGSLRQILD